MADVGVEQFPIRTVSRLTGVKPITLRAWERRYGVVRPERTRTGHRLYTYWHVERIRRVLALLDRGIPISRVARLLDAQRAADPATRPRSGPWRSYRERLNAAVTEFDERELDRVYEEVLALHPIERVTRELLLPSLARLGKRWEGLPGGIAEEHFFATYVRSKLGARLQYHARYAVGVRVLGACAPDEHHELALLLFALEGLTAGLQTIVLGANTPLGELAVAQSTARCKAIVISSSVENASWLQDGQLHALVRQVKVPVFVGGATGVRRHAAVDASGAIGVGLKIQDGVQLIARRLGAVRGPD